MTLKPYQLGRDGQVRIIIADDHPVVRTGLKRELEQVEGLAVIGEAPAGDVALELIKDKRPDLLLLDIHMPGLDGIQVMEQLNQPNQFKASHKPRVLALSTHQDPIYVFNLIAAGANGYLLKHEPISRIICGIRQVMAGRPALSTAIQQLLRKHQPTGLAPLTSGEQDVLQLLAIGYSDADIAAALKLPSIQSGTM